MADKSKQRARALQRKTGMSYQAAHSALAIRRRRTGETRAEPKKLRDTYALEQLREAILSLREQDVGDPEIKEILTEIPSLRHVDVKRRESTNPVPLIALELLEWSSTGIPGSSS